MSGLLWWWVLLVIFLSMCFGFVGWWWWNNKRITKTENLKEYNVIFAGTCRNVESDLPSVLEHIDTCGSMFGKYAVVIYENDSADATRSILMDHAESRSGMYSLIFEDGIDEKEPRRTMRLERGRNLILDKVHEINAQNEYDFLVILDLDNVNASGRFVETIGSCFQHDGDDDWDVLTANQQTGYYYDIWALRKRPDLNYDFARYQPQPGGKDKSMFYLQFDPNEAPDLVEVDSAFGGIAIYRLSTLPKNCRYRGEYKDGGEKCEHVDFNQCLRNHGNKIFINKQFFTY